VYPAAIQLRFLQTLTEVAMEREKLNDDPSSPDRLTHSVLAKEGEGITQAIF
jgi:hypothetical protein